MSNLGKVFHISNPDTLSWRELVQQISKLGRGIEIVPYEKWVDCLDACPGHLLADIEGFLRLKLDNERYYFKYIADCKQADRFSTERLFQIVPRHFFPSSADLARYYYGPTGK
jgi:hypothetical protein